MPKTKIEKLREDKGWERVDLASKANVSERTLFNMETKAFPRPSFRKTQERIAEALGVEVRTIFKEDVPR